MANKKQTLFFALYSPFGVQRLAAAFRLSRRSIVTQNDVMLYSLGMLGLAPKLGTKSLGARATSLGLFLLQFGFHTFAVYMLVRWITPRLAELTYSKISPILLRRPLAESSIQFFFSHLLAFSFFPAFVAGFVSVKFLRRGATLAWAIPVAILAYGFFFASATVYPTTIWDSDFAPAIHNYFGGGFNIPVIHDYKDLTLDSGLMGDFLRGSLQFRTTAPAYGGIAYSLGAWLYVLVLKLRRRASSRDYSGAALLI
jgi:hypothetical protein